MHLPLFALLMAPLALLPKAVAAGVWYVLSVAMLLHMIVVSVRLAEARAGPSRMGAFWVGAFTLALAGWPWMSGLTRGQASVMLSWLTIVAIDQFQQRRAVARWTGAFARALATTIRIFPGVLGAWLLMQRQWRAALACIVAGIVPTLIVPAFVFGPRRDLALIQEWATTIVLPTGDVEAVANVRYAQMMHPYIGKNQSVQATLIRWAPPAEVVGRDERAAREAAMAINVGLAAVTLGGCLAGAWRRGADDAELPLLQAAVISTLVLFLPPVSWTHNYSLMILPLTLALVRATGPYASRVARRVLVVWLLFALVAFVPGIGRYNEQSGESLGAFLAGGLVVWAWLVFELLRAGRSPSTAQSTRAARGQSSILAP